MPSLKRVVKRRSTASSISDYGNEVLVDGIDEGFIRLAAVRVCAGFHRGLAGVRHVGRVVIAEVGRKKSRMAPQSDVTKPWKPQSLVKVVAARSFVLAQAGTLSTAL